MVILSFTGLRNKVTVSRLEVKASWHKILDEARNSRIPAQVPMTALATQMNRNETAVISSNAEAAAAMITGVDPGIVDSSVVLLSTNATMKSGTNETGRPALVTACAIPVGKFAFGLVRWR